MALVAAANSQNVNLYITTVTIDFQKPLETGAFYFRHVLPHG